MTVQDYIISFLLGDEKLEKYVQYGNINDKPEAKIIIVPSSFFNREVFGTKESMPRTPFENIPDTNIPFLFGESKIEYNEKGCILLYVDLVASAFFLLSRYEEIIKTNCRDEHGRFLSKYSIIYQQGYGLRPLVDEWGYYLRELLRTVNVEVQPEIKGFKKIYLTHDVDSPFLFYRKNQVIKQWVKNLIHHGRKIDKPLYKYNHPEDDPHNTFDKIIETDTWLESKYEKGIVESIYFIIAAGTKKSKSYCNIELKKFQDLIKKLNYSNATLGLHVSYEAGGKPELIYSEMTRLLEKCPNSCKKSRHHFLRWTEPEHIELMEKAGITDDFSLGYADSVGFRVGTCKPYRFINPKTLKISNVIIHPMEIMECSLDRKIYMGLDYEKAKQICKKIIDEVYKNHGELNILWHNTSKMSA